MAPMEPAADAALAQFRATLPEVAALYAVIGRTAGDKACQMDRKLAASVTLDKRVKRRLRQAARAERLRALAAEIAAPLAAAEGREGPAGALGAGSEGSAGAAGACAGHVAAAQPVPALGAAIASAVPTALSPGLQTASPTKPLAGPEPWGAPDAGGASAAMQGTAASADGDAAARHPAQAACAQAPDGAAAAGQQAAGASSKEKRKKEAEAGDAAAAEPRVAGVQAARRACMQQRVEAALCVLAAGLPGAAPWLLNDIAGLSVHDGGARAEPSLHSVLPLH